MTKRYYPEEFNVITSADDIGALIDLQRITGEDLYTYKKRVLESSERISNSSYEGLINGINRELGLTRKDIMQICLKQKYAGSFLHPQVSFSVDTIHDGRTYSGTIDGTSITAIGNIVTSNVHIWDENMLVGLSFILNSKPYLIKSNTINTITLVDADISAAVGQTYLIKANWEPNKFNGLSLFIEGRKYTIIENSTNTIRVNRKIYYREDPIYYMIASRPRVEVTSAKIFLYSEYLNEDNFKLDLEIDLRQLNLSHKDIINYINKNSLFFYAINLIPLASGIPAFTIKQQDSSINVFQEKVPGTKYFKLKYGNVLDGSLKFSETDIFLKEVDMIEEVPMGPYFQIDHAQGIVRTKYIPSGKGVVSYTHMDFPFKVESVPAIITSFADDNSQNFLFAQKEKIIYENQRDKHISSQPKGKMIEYISELLSINNQAWGE